MTSERSVVNPKVLSPNHSNDVIKRALKLKSEGASIEDIARAHPSLHIKDIERMFEFPHEDIRECSSQLYKQSHHSVGEKLYIILERVINEMYEPIRSKKAPKELIKKIDIKELSLLTKIFVDLDDRGKESVSYTHLTLPTICSV